MMMNSHGESVDLPSELVHDLMTEDEVHDIKEPGTITVSASDVKKTTGPEKWRVATEQAYVENFVQKNVSRVATEADKRQYGPPLPMKLVYTLKKGKIHKVRQWSAAIFNTRIHRNNFGLHKLNLRV